MRKVRKFTPVPIPTCLKCGEEFGTLLVVTLHNGERGVEHACGTVYTRGFMRDHYGIEWEEADPLSVVP